MKANEEQLKKHFSLFAGNSGGLDSWLGNEMKRDVIERLASIDSDPLPKVQFNQLLILSHEAGVSDGFFRYYWLDTPLHVYDVKKIERYSDSYASMKAITSLDHLYWGLYRVYVDSLLFYGSIRNGYRALRDLSYDELDRYFRIRRVDTNAVKDRGPPLALWEISKDNRYLISEMACKSYDSSISGKADLEDALLTAWRAHLATGGGRIRIRDLLDGSAVAKKFADHQSQFAFSADDILDDEIESEAELQEKYDTVKKAFQSSRESALQNTRRYLSMVNELDVYVATSMRTRDDFRKMADTCEEIFSDASLADLHLRYFDPTMSAAEGHEDKGLIECLMVKSAKVLLYSAGAKESFGKDAEAAMALSLGKPVIFLCDEDQRKRFYRDVHPLSRLINFKTGVAGGAMVNRPGILGGPKP